MTYVCENCRYEDVDRKTEPCASCFEWCNFCTRTLDQPVKPFRGDHAYLKEASKFDDRKLRMSLFPPDVLNQICEVLEFGAAKYGDNNWRKGMEWTRLYDAAQRHLQAWLQNEDLDKESNINHLAHACCNLVFLLNYVNSQKGEDNRPKS